MAFPKDRVNSYRSLLKTNYGTVAIGLYNKTTNDESNLCPKERLVGAHSSAGRP